MAGKEKEDDGARADGRGESAAGGGRLARRARGATWRANPESGVVGAEEEEEGEGHGSRAALARGLSMAGCRLPSPLAKEGEGSGSLEEGLSLSLSPLVRPRCLWELGEGPFEPLLHGPGLLYPARKCARL